jgi:hypothetical protein
VAVVNRPESSVIEDKVVQIARRYPQALYYPFKVVESNLEVNVLDADVGETTPLFQRLKLFFSKQFGNLNKWVEALDCLVYPEHRFKYWYQILCDLLASEKATPERILGTFRMMLADIASVDKQWVGDQIGSYNRKFAQIWVKSLTKVFGENGAKVPGMPVKQLATLMLQMN